MNMFNLTKNESLSSSKERKSGVILTCETVSKRKIAVFTRK